MCMKIGYVQSKKSKTVYSNYSRFHLKPYRNFQILFVVFWCFQMRPTNLIFHFQTNKKYSIDFTYDTAAGESKPQSNIFEQ